MRSLRGLLLFKLGVWVGMMGAAAFVRRTVPSRGGEDSDELALVAVLDGIDLKSRATNFKGGSMLAWFGGIAVDLREVELAPRAELSLHTLFGGIAVITPPGWQIESELKALAGGVDAPKPAQNGPDSPVLTVSGSAVLGGISVATKAPVDDPARAAAAAQNGEPHD